MSQPMTHHICEVKSMKFVFPNAQHHESVKDNPDLRGEEGVELHIIFEDSFSKLETCVVFNPEQTRPVYEHVKALLNNLLDEREASEHVSLKQ
jgi:hypothetical protein